MPATKPLITNSPSQGSNYKKLGPVLRICHFNAEGMSRSKCECLYKVLKEQKIDILALQETHIEDTENSARGKIPGYRLVDSIGHRVYGVATYVRQDIDDVTVSFKSSDDNVFILAVRVSETTVVNVYKPPTISWPDTVLPVFNHPVLYVGDFNSHHSQWGYSSNDNNGIDITRWAETNNLHLVFDAKDPSTFHSARWGRGYNPDLCFSSCDNQLRPLPTSRKVLGAFPRSQHRPVVISVGIEIPLVRSFPRPRWNFNKADWGAFTTKLERGIRFVPVSIKNYDRFTGLILSTAKCCIPRGFRKEYIPGWSQESEDLFEEFNSTGNSNVADQLLFSLDSSRREKWEETMKNLNFSRSSRKAWSLLRKLSSGNPLNPHANTGPDPSDIARRLVGISKSARQLSDKKIIYQLNDIKRSHQAPMDVSRPFTVAELEEAITALPAGKAAGWDNMFPEFIKHVGPKVKHWLLSLFNTIMKTGQLPAAFKRSKVVAVLKPGKTPERVESYRPIALLSVCYKLLERIIYNRIQPILNASIPQEQAGFRPGRNCCDQVLALTTFIENGFEKKLKTSTAFIDLTSAYDTVWRKGLLVKLYNLIPCISLLRLVNSMLSSRLFKVFLGSRESTFKQVNDGLPQGSVLAPLLFNVYTADIPTTLSRKFIYADDIALAVQHKDHRHSEVALTDDLNALKDYFQTWKLRPNPAKTEVSCFHLDNRLANLKLNITFNGETLTHTKNPQYLGVTLDRSLTFKSHIQKAAAKTRSRVNIIQHLTGTSWGANAEVLRTSALSLVFSAAEYCAPVWLNSVHAREIDVQLNRVMRLVSGTLMPTPLPWLPVLCNIAPPEIRRRDALVREFRKITSAPNLPLFQTLPCQESRLKSRRPPLRTASQLIREDFTVKLSWIKSWDTFEGRNKFLISDPTEAVCGSGLPRKEWTTLNRFRTGVGRCNYLKLKWGLTDDQHCDCGAGQQTMDHIVNSCPLRLFGDGLVGLHRVDEAGEVWLKGLDLAV